MTSNEPIRWSNEKKSNTIKTDLRNRFTTKTSATSLDVQVEALGAELGQIGGVLEKAGGEEGIRGLFEAAEQAEREKEQAKREVETVGKQMDEANKEKKEVERQKDQAKREKAEAVMREIEMVRDHLFISLCSYFYVLVCCFRPYRFCMQSRAYSDRKAIVNKGASTK